MSNNIRTRPLTIFKVIEFLTDNPDANFTETQKKTGLSTRTLNKAFKQLELNNMISRERWGKSTCFTVNNAQAAAYLHSFKRNDNRFKHLIEGFNRFTSRQLYEAQLIEATNRQYSGKVRNWSCSEHGQKHVKLGWLNVNEFGSMKGDVLVYCDANGCTQSQAFSFFKKKEMLNQLFSLASNSSTFRSNASSAGFEASTDSKRCLN